MLRHRVIPTLLLKNNGLVKTIKFKNPTYIGDPINAVRIFNDKEVDELVLLDITATKNQQDPNYDKIKEIVSEAFMPVGYGGRIKSLQQIEKLFRIGLEKVIINSAAYKNSSLIQEAAEVFGNQSIVVAVDVKKDLLGKYRLYSNSGKKKETVRLNDHLNKMIDSGCGEIYINSMDKDGTMSGYDIDLIKNCANLINVPLIASGGAGKVDDFADAVKAGASAVSAGALFVFQGIHRAVLISYPDYSELEIKLKEL